MIQSEWMGMNKNIKVSSFESNENTQRQSIGQNASLFKKSVSQHCGDRNDSWDREAAL